MAIGVVLLLGWGVREEVWGCRTRQAQRLLRVVLGMSILLLGIRGIVVLEGALLVQEGKGLVCRRVHMLWM
jgi:hypothetical protein